VEGVRNDAAGEAEAGADERVTGLVSFSVRALAPLTLLNGLLTAQGDSRINLRGTPRWEIAGK
jgi:hypothetical protein